MLERQFVSFLVDRIEAKVGDIKRQTSGETTKFTADETQIYIDQLKSVVAQVFESDDESPKPATPRKPRRTTGQRGESTDENS